MTKDKLIEVMARAICRKFRVLQGFKGSPEYSMDDEVWNCWDLFIPDAQAVLKALLDEGYVVEQGWRLIETVPPEPGNYLILDAGVVPCEGFLNADGKWRVCANPFRNITRPGEPTHWRPMPDPPAKNDADDGGEPATKGSA